jgi:hypothetical protein
MTTNPVVIQILTELGMPEDEALRQLENNTLDLRCFGEYVTDNIAGAIVENCAGLTTINLWGCESITDTAVIALAERCASLTTINLGFCHNITDAAVFALAERCAGLTTIDLRWCRLITDAAVIVLAERCVGLTKINLHGCWNITDNAVTALAEKCEYLGILNCNATNVSATGHQLIEKIRTRPKPPPLEEGWWMDDGTGPRCKGMMN